MRSNTPSLNVSSKGSIILVSSTSGYFGGTGVAGYIASKHGVTGLLRGSQSAAAKYGIRVNAVAPFITPTAISVGFSDEWSSKGLPSNTPEGVAKVVLTLACDGEHRGSCYLTCGPIIVELEKSRQAVTMAWVGKEAAELMATAGKFFEERGGYTLPSLNGMR